MNMGKLDVAEAGQGDAMDVFAACGVRGNQPQMVLVNMTRAVAVGLLAMNTKNRPRRPQAISELTAEFTSGRYVLTGDALMVSTERKLVQGQHRLLAFVRACDVMAKRGEPQFSIPFWVYFNAAPLAMEVADKGVKRTTWDDFVAIDNEDPKNIKQFTTVLRSLYILDTDIVHVKFTVREARVARSAFGGDARWTMGRFRSHDNMSAAPWLAAVAYARAAFPSEIDNAVRALKDPEVPLAGTLRLIRSKLDGGGVGRGGTVSRNDEAYMFLGALQKVCTGAGAKAAQLKETHDGKRILGGYEFFRRARERAGLPVLERRVAAEVTP